MIRNAEYMSQVVDFGSLQMGTRIPTDLDGLFDYGGKAWVVFEMKYAGATMPFGQELALRRLVDDLTKARPTIGIVAEHCTPYPQKINAASAAVVKFRYRYKWFETGGAYTLKYAIEGFINKHVV